MVVLFQWKNAALEGWSWKGEKELSSTNEYEVNLPFITADADGPKHFEYKLTRAKLEELVKELIDGVASPVEKALKDAGLTAKDIDEVVLVGGMTRMPAVVEKVRLSLAKTHSRSQPRRSRGHRRRYSGWRATRRCQGCATARRDSAKPRYRDNGRRHQPSWLNVTRLSQPASQRHLVPLPTTSHKWKSMCCKVSEKWLTTTNRSDALCSMA